MDKFAYITSLDDIKQAKQKQYKACFIGFEVLHTFGIPFTALLIKEAKKNAFKVAIDFFKSNGMCIEMLDEDFDIAILKKNKAYTEIKQIAEKKSKIVYNSKNKLNLEEIQ